MSIALRRASEASQLQSTLCDSVTQKLRVWAPQAKAGKRVISLMSRKTHFPKTPHPHKHWVKSHFAFEKRVNSSPKSRAAHDTVPMESSIYSIAYIEVSDPVRLTTLPFHRQKNLRRKSHPFIRTLAPHAKRTFPAACPALLSDMALHERTWP